MEKGVICFVIFCCLIEGKWSLILLLRNELYCSLLFCLQSDGPLSNFGNVDKRWYGQGQIYIPPFLE